MGTILALLVLNLYLLVLYIKGPLRITRLRSQHPLVSVAGILVSGFIVPPILCLAVMFGTDYLLDLVVTGYAESNTELSVKVMPILLINEGLAILAGIVIKIIWVFDDQRGTKKELKPQFPSHN